MHPGNRRSLLRSAQPAAFATPALLPFADPAGVTVVALAVVAAGALLATALRRRDPRAWRRLRSEIHTLERAFVPDVPAEIHGVTTSVASNRSSGSPSPAFYDVFPVAGDRIALLGGTLFGVERRGLEHVMLTRHALRAHLEAGLEPRAALARASSVVDRAGDVAAAVVAVHDPRAGTLTYATAGHAPPLIGGSAEHDPVTHSASPPLGLGVATGLRQTIMPLPPGAIVCIHTASAAEAPVPNGRLGETALRKMLGQIGPPTTAAGLLAAVGRQTKSDLPPMAACVAVTATGAPPARARIEELQVSLAELDQGRAGAFLHVCGLAYADAHAAVSLARVRAARFGTAVLRVRLEPGPAIAEIRTADPESPTAPRAPTADDATRAPPVPPRW